MTERQCREIIAARSQGRCERCGRWGYTVHHRRKRSQGGQWTPDNCVALCGSGTTGCHGFVEAHPEIAHQQGYWLFAGDTTSLPVLYRHRWQVLDEEGGVTPVTA